MFTSLSQSPLLSQHRETAHTVRLFGRICKAQSSVEASIEDSLSWLLTQGSAAQPALS